MPQNRLSDLPSFRHPPVVEVVVGVQFEPIAGFCQAHLGVFWDEIRSEFPGVSDHARLQTPIEVAEADNASMSLRLQFVDAPPVNRSWFASADDVWLVQAQDDRLLLNWRLKGQEYPRFEPILERFWQAYAAYCAAVEKTGLRVSSWLQAEVAYVNWIPVERMEQFFVPADAAEVRVESVGPAPDTQHWSARYPVVAGDDRIGSLSVETQPGNRVESEHRVSGFQLGLTFRSALPAQSTKETVGSRLETGRRAIVRTFAALTTEAMHKEWGRTDVADR